MAIIKCPECGQDISDKAEKCIHCGYPLSRMKNSIDTNPVSDSAEPKESEESADTLENAPQESAEEILNIAGSSDAVENAPDLAAPEEPGIEPTAKGDSNDGGNSGSTKKIAAVVAAAVVLIAIAAGVYWKQVVQPKNLYASAQDLMDKERYDEADEILAGLGDYEDALQLREDIKNITDYQRAIELADAGEYSEAYEIFTGLGNYEDAEKIQEELRYESCGYSAIASIDSDGYTVVEVHSIDFYSGRVDESTSDTSSLANQILNNDEYTIDDNHPLVIAYIKVQNDSGSDVDSYVVSGYNSSAGKYTLIGLTPFKDMDSVSRYFSTEDNFITILTGAFLIEYYESFGIKTGNIDKDRFSDLVTDGTFLTIDLLS